MSAKKNTTRKPAAKAQEVKPVVLSDKEAQELREKVAAEMSNEATPEMTHTIDQAQIKRNISVSTSTTSLFCRLLESKNQNYRIDKALENFHTMRELMKLTDCSESRIKSHMTYIKRNCSHAKLEIDSANNKRFKFVVAE